MEDESFYDSTLFQLNNLYLKKIIKENHQHDIKQLIFCEHHPNILASVGGTQASVYDNENCGEHLDIMLNFVNMDTPALQQVLSTCPQNDPFSSHETSHTDKNNPSSSHNLSSNVPIGFGSNMVNPKAQNQSEFEMHQIIEEGGFDEDIYVGTKKKRLFKPDRTSQIHLESDLSDENAQARPGTIISSDTQPNVLANKRQMQGIGRDVEHFDKKTSEIKACAWVALPSRTLLSAQSIAQLVSRDDMNPNPSPLFGTEKKSHTSRFNGILDVEISRVDRTDAWLAIGGNDSLIQLVSVAYCKSLYVLPGHYEPIISIASGRSSTVLASLSNSKIIVWNLPLIARHHFNACHSGGPGLEDIEDEFDIMQRENYYLEKLEKAKNFASQKPIWRNTIKKEHMRFVMQYFQTPSDGLVSIQFCHLGLLAAGRNGKMYLWRWLSADSTNPMFRNSSGKRTIDGELVQKPIWAKIPNSMVSEDYEIIAWPYKDEVIDQIVAKPPTAESKAAAVCCKTNTGRVILFDVISNMQDISLEKYAPYKNKYIYDGNTNSNQEQAVPILILSKYKIRQSSQSVINLQSGSLVTNSVSKDEEGEVLRTGLDVTSCGLFGCVGTLRGDVHIFDLQTGQEIRTLEHKRSKSRIASCLFAHHTKNVLYCSDSIIWRWDFLDPEMLQRERDQQARAIAEGIDVESEVVSDQEM